MTAAQAAGNVVAKLRGMRSQVALAAVRGREVGGFVEEGIGGDEARRWSRWMRSNLSGR